MNAMFTSLQQYNLLDFIALGSLILLLISVAIDRKKFRNAIFLQFTLIAAVICLVYHLRETGIVNYVYLLLLLIVFFLLIVVPILLIFNGFIIVKREGLSLSNLIALLFSILIICGEFASLFCIAGVGPNTSLTLICLAFLFSAAVFFVSMVFLAFMFYSFFIRIIPGKIHYDYVVVLGCGLINGERVSKLLSQRIDKGIKVYQRSGGACKLIMSGGKGSDEKLSEAQAMKNYALEQGIPEEDILLEDASVNTMENLANSKKIIDARDGKHATAVVTSQYHMLRANVYAEHLHFPVTGIGAPTALYYWPAAITREYAGLVKHYWKTYLFFFLLFMAPLIYIVIQSYS